MAERSAIERSGYREAAHQGQGQFVGAGVYSDNSAEGEGAEHACHVSKLRVSQSAMHVRSPGPLSWAFSLSLSSLSLFSSGR